MYLCGLVVQVQSLCRVDLGLRVAGIVQDSSGIEGLDVDDLDIYFFIVHFTPIRAQSQPPFPFLYVSFSREGNIVNFRDMPRPATKGLLHFATAPGVHRPWI